MSEDYRGQPALVSSAAARREAVDAALARFDRRWRLGFQIAGWAAAIGWSAVLHPGWGDWLFATAWVVCWSSASYVRGRSQP